jgi:hypothetical protein
MIAAALCLALPACSTQSSDVAAIRREFRIPRHAEVVSYSASPSESGWFGREGLKIAVVFQLTPQDYDSYAAKARASGKWSRLPIPDEYLRRMASIQSAKRYRIDSYASGGETIPPEGSVYNPTEEQMLEQFSESLPVQPKDGLFQVRTAGTDVLRAPKSVVLRPDRDLPDFMLAMLDHDQKRIVVKVSTGY